MMTTWSNPDSMSSVNITTAAPKSVRTGLRERGDVVDIERAEPCGDTGFEIVVGEEFTEREGGRRKSTGSANPGATQFANHFSQPRVLAADRVDIGQAQTIEWNDSL